MLVFTVDVDKVRRWSIHLRWPTHSSYARRDIAYICILNADLQVGRGGGVAPDVPSQLFILLNCSGTNLPNLEGWMACLARCGDRTIDRVQASRASCHLTPPPSPRICQDTHFSISGPSFSPIFILCFIFFLSISGWYICSAYMSVRRSFKIRVKAGHSAFSIESLFKWSSEANDVAIFQLSMHKDLNQFFM